MVLLSAAICNKTGKVIISRQFVEMTRSRIDGLLSAFPKLMNTGKQHTFVETESVRYVYQPMEKLYMVLITTKASNILEDLETLRLFARVVPEYCKAMEESEVLKQSFQLIFAFDEVIALGYRESVNLTQIRTFTEMNSLAEEIAKAQRRAQEKEQREHMKLKAKELQYQRKASGMGGGGKRMPGIVGIGGGMGGQSGRSDSSTDTILVETSKPSHTAPKPSPSGKAMKLGSKAKDVDMFVDQLKSEGETVSTGPGAKKAAASKVTAAAISQEPVHIHTEEKISLTAGRDGGLRNLEVQGMVSLRVTDESFNKIKILVANNDKSGVQLQPHPNMDKKMFQASSVLQSKSNKPFPVNVDAGILRWRFQTSDDSFIPLSINCWPNESGSGCDVNIEYELERPELEMKDVTISIPLPSGGGAPVVNECDGEYHYESRKGLLEWSLPLIDQSNKSGSMEFSINGHPDDFFPVNVTFQSTKTFCDVFMAEVRLIDGESPVKFSSDAVLQTEKYEIV